MIHILRGGWDYEGNTQTIGVFSNEENALEFLNKYFIKEIRPDVSENEKWYLREGDFDIPMFDYTEIVEFPLNPTEY